MKLIIAFIFFVSFVLARQANTTVSVRVIHGSPDVGNFTAVVVGPDEKNYTLGNLVFSEALIYMTLPTDNYTLILFQEVVNVTTELFKQNLTFLIAGSQTTLVLLGSRTELNLGVYTDTNTAPQNPNVFSVRAINGAVGSTVSVFANEDEYFTNVNYLQATNYNTSLRANVGYYVRFATATNQVFATYTSSLIAGGYIYTLLIVGLNGSSPMVFAYADAAYQYFSLRAVHAVSDVAAVSVILDNGISQTSLVDGLAYKSASQRQYFLLTGHYTISVKTDANTTVYKGNGPTNVGDFTFGFVGFNQTINSVLLVDNLANPTSSVTTSLRAIHFAFGVPNINIAINSQFPNGFENIAFGTQSSFTSQTIPGNNNRIDVYSTNNSANILSSPGLSFPGGQVDTFFLFGTPGNLVGLVSSDITFSYFNIRVTNAAPQTGPISVLLDGTSASSVISYPSTSNFTSIVNSGIRYVTVVNSVEKNVILSKSLNFPSGQDSTLIISGLTQNNTAFPLTETLVVNPPTTPSDNTKSLVRFINLVASNLIFTININGTQSLTIPNVGYTMTTVYNSFSSGVYHISVMSGNETIVTGNSIFIGGTVYTFFLEGLVGGVSMNQQVDYFPSPNARLRVFQASPFVADIDTLIDGSSYGFNGIAYSKDTSYVSFTEGNHNLTFRQTNSLSNYLVTQSTFSMNDYSIFFLNGMKNSTNNITEYDVLITTDNNVLPTTPGHIKIRFVHTCIDSNAITIRLNSNVLFNSTLYKQVSNYTEIPNQIYTLDAFDLSTNAVLFTSSFDLRVIGTETAVYTLVAEGLAHPINGEPSLKLYLFLDAGSGNPPAVTSSSGNQGLSGVAIGLIIAGVAVAIIILAAAVFFLWKRNQKRAEYSEIARSE